MIDFARIIEEIRLERNSLTRQNKALQAEYCYQLVSLLMESEKLINGDWFAFDYVEEKTGALMHLRKTAERIKTGEIVE